MKVQHAVAPMAASGNWRRYIDPILRGTGLGLLLPMFFQLFHYAGYTGPLYVLSKGFPLITAPLALMGILARPPFTLLVLLTFLYVVTVAPAMTMVFFDQGYLSAVTGTVKMLPLLYYFSLFVVLVRLRPSAVTIERTLEVLGAINMLLLVVLWNIVPDDAYGNTPELKDTLFVWEMERGNRILLPMFFGKLFVLYEFRTGLHRRQFWRIAVALACFPALIIIYKERTVVAGLALLLALAVFWETPRNLRHWFILPAIPVVIAGLFWLQTKLSDIGAELGGSLSVRQGTIEIALRYLSDHPTGWFFGVGALTSSSDTKFEEIFHHYFYLADVGFIGVMFEYGLVGVALIYMLYAATLFTALNTPRERGAGLSLAITDYMLFLFATSAVHSMAHAPGEVASLLAISVYMRWYAPAPLAYPAPPAAAGASSAAMVRSRWAPARQLPWRIGTASRLTRPG